MLLSLMVSRLSTQVDMALFPEGWLTTSGKVPLNDCAGGSLGAEYAAIPKRMTDCTWKSALQITNTLLIGFLVLAGM